MKRIEDYIRNIPDFPKKGILFRDITGALRDADGLRLTIDSLSSLIEDIDCKYIAGIEARGFLVGSPLAYKLHKGFIPVRKKGKLPCETITAEYDLEYGTAEIEIDRSAIEKGDKVVIIDDLMATGGTVEAAIRLVEKLGGEVVKVIALIELVDLKGRERIKNYSFDSVIKYEGE